jgi:hypothetical protein
VRVAWVQDISRPHGGAENSNRTVVAAGERLGFDVVGITPLNFIPGVLKEADALVLNNFHQFDRLQAQMVLETMRSKPYAVYSHDARDLRRAGLWDRVLRESRLNVFISPRHLKLYEDKYKCHGVALPLAVDAELFRPVAGVAREEGVALIVGGWIKGGKTGRDLRGFVGSHNTYRYVSVGHVVPGATVVGTRPLEEMPALYSSVGALVHYPDIECAGERVVFEAALCGVKKFHLGERVGHASWGFDLSDESALRDVLGKAPVTFWSLVRERCR